jgi:hypothetical protein
VARGVVELIDVMPSLLELAGLTPPAQQHAVKRPAVTRRPAAAAAAHHCALASWGWLSRLLAALRTRHEPLRRSGPNTTGCGAVVKAPAEAADAAALGMQVRPLLAAVQGAFLAQLAAWLLYGEGCEEGQG